MAHQDGAMSRRPGGRATGLAAVLALGCTDLKITTPGPVVSVRVSPDTVALRIGDSVFVKVAPLDAESSLRSQEPVTWSSSNGAVATVESDGLVLALGAGTATISATVNGLTDSATILVSGPPANITAYAGTGQSAAVNSAVAIAPAVRVTDAGTNPVAFVPVTFSATVGGGNVTGGGPVFTDINGVARVGAWTLGPSPVSNTLTATAGGSGITGN